MLNFKGFLAIQAQRVAHRLWQRGQVPLALVIQNRVSEVFAVGAGTHVLGNVKIGAGVVLKEVPEKTTAVGNPARLLSGTVGGKTRSS
ncbi:Serine acetyltransferase 3 [Nymphaea thermarum]|nr:Serine acetyltransferase 3 [Nymphaea thermarum]